VTLPGSTIVVDASVLVKWFIPEPNQVEARAIAEHRTLLAPDFLQVECASVFWKRVKRGDMAPEAAEAALNALRAVPIIWIRDADLVVPARELAAENDHPIYDCLYLALALRFGVPVVTADRRFAALAERSSRLAGALVLLESLA